MNTYRVALILCRAVTVALWWMAGVRLVSAFIAIVGGAVGVFGRGFSVAQLSLQMLISVAPLFVVAGFLQIFAVSLAASMTGSAAFEGDSIASRRTLDATEKALSYSGAGLFLLFFGAASAIPATFGAVYMLLFEGIGTGAGSSYALYSLVNNALPAILQCVVGFVLAFSLALRRAVQSP